MTDEWKIQQKLSLSGVGPPCAARKASLQFAVDSLGLWGSPEEIESDSFKFYSFVRCLHDGNGDTVKIFGPNFPTDVQFDQELVIVKSTVCDSHHSF